MCSSTNDSSSIDYSQMIKTESSPLNQLVCQKCNNEKAEVTLRKKDVYCNGCFLISATHKFRATLGRSKIVRPSDTILVGHNGQAGSTALLNLIKAGMDESVHKRLIFNVKLLYIDDGLIMGQSMAERQIKLTNIYKQVEALGFPAYGIVISEAMSSDNLSISFLEDKTRLNDQSKGDEELLKMWNKLTDETCKKDFLLKLREKVMVMAAKILKCQKIFLADDSTSLAIAILSNVALGRGAHLSSDCGFIDNRHKDVMILRPMRDFSRQELYYYLRIRDIKCIDEEELKDNLHPSIQKLTGKFVRNLEDEFSGTVSTIFRTGEKIVTGKENNRNNISTEQVCAFCNGCLDTIPIDGFTSSIDAKNFSKIVSAESANAEWNLAKLMKISPENKKNVQEYSCQDCRCNNMQALNHNIEYEQIRHLLCYACQSIFNDNFTLHELPFYVVKSVSRKLRLEDIAGEIQKFLL
uniref:Cytoplasmic tRNA 2-thiolation protein 2 n=1 Tax=Fopius arisanus TaxID=64838 RepID=A0A0C9RFS3_9HYME